jgi:glutamate-1-semialdehyde aminotransferase
MCFLVQVLSDRSIGLILFEAFHTPGFGCWLPKEVAAVLVTLQREQGITLVADEVFTAMFRWVCTGACGTQL